MILELKTSSSRPFGMTFKNGLLDGMELKFHSIEISREPPRDLGLGVDYAPVHLPSGDIILKYDMNRSPVYSDVANMSRCLSLIRDAHCSGVLYPNQYKSDCVFDVLGVQYHIQGIFAQDFEHTLDTDMNNQSIARLKLLFDMVTMK